MHAYLSLGSNIGDRLENLANARKALNDKFKIIKESSIYETAPWGYEDQPDFLNQVIEIDVQLPPAEFLRIIKDIEKKLGREKSFKYGPRNIDIDILTYGNLVYHSGRLSIPHPKLGERAFVVIPLEEIAPKFRHPVTDRDIRSMSEEVDAQGVRHYSS